MPEPEGIVAPSLDASPDDAPAPPTGLPPTVLAGLVIAGFVLVGALAALLVRSGDRISIDPIVVFIAFVLAVVAWELRRFVLVGLRAIGLDAPDREVRGPQPTEVPHTSMVLRDVVRGAVHLSFVVVAVVIVGAVATWLVHPALHPPFNNRFCTIPINSIESLWTKQLGPFDERCTVEIGSRTLAAGAVVLAIIASAVLVTLRWWLDRDPPISPTVLTRHGRTIRRAGLLVVVAVAVGGGLVAWVFGTSLPFIGPRTVEWRLGDLDPKTAQTTTVIPIGIDEYPPESCYAPAPDWLQAPKITYTPWAVIITMRKTDAYASAHCGGFYTTNWSGTVQLSEPLGGRALLDGSAFPPAPRPLRSGTASLEILAISDWQGQVEPLSGIGGAAALSTYFEQERADHRGTMTLSTGSDVGASPPLSSFFQDTPAILSEGMMGIQVGMLGRHDFDAGIGRLQSQIDLAYSNAWDTRFGYVASNLSERAANLEGVDDYQILQYGDAKFAVIGIADETAPAPVAPGSLGTMSRTDGVTAAMAAKAAAKAEGADVFIAITDKGVTGSSGSNPTGDLIDFANAVSGFDVIFGSGTDTEYSGTVNGQLVVANRSRGMTYSKTLLTYDRLAAQLTTASNTFVTPTAASVTADPDIEAMLGAYRSQMSLLQDGTIPKPAPPPAPPTSPTSHDRSAECVAVTSQVPGYARRLALDIASLRPLVVAEPFDPAGAAIASRQLTDTLDAWAAIDPPYHGCNSSSELTYQVEYVVAMASRRMGMTQAAGITAGNLPQRVMFDLYGYLARVAAWVDAPSPPSP